MGMILFNVAIIWFASSNDWQWWGMLGFLMLNPTFALFVRYFSQIEEIKRRKANEIQ